MPPYKRQTRLNRLEKSRRKLEQFCFETSKGFPCSGTLRDDRVVSPEAVLATPNFSSARHSTPPENPFIVPAVFEDLKHRWSRENILSVAKEIMCVPHIHLADFPWADITTMVSGEADGRCARLAGRSNSAILTNDSDLLLYDLGSSGSVMLLNSLYMLNWDPIAPATSKLKSLRMCPASIAERLGITDLKVLAYCLQNNPHMRLTELIQQSSLAHGRFRSMPAFSMFLHEYRVDLNDDASRITSLDLDARVSELFWQYELREAFAPSNTPHMYLTVLTEDNSRRCAWATGLSFRTLAYSILNSSRAAPERHLSINEFGRRGRRITSHEINLGDDEWIISQMSETWARMQLFEAALGHTPLPVYWIMFALYEIYTIEEGKMFPGSEQLKRFLILGHMGEQLELKWADIHLNAQILAVLYSLRILSQLLQTTKLDSGVAPQLRNMLATLPSLHLMMRHASQIMRCLSSDTIGNLVARFFQLLGDAHSETLQGLTQSTMSATETRKSYPRILRNIYDLLEPQ